jgi:hypothetical protein
MSTAQHEPDLTDLGDADLSGAVEHRPAAGSLAERAEKQRQRLANQVTETFDVPGYVGILKVEYQALDYPDLRKITKRHERVRDEAQQELLTAVDTLMAASVNSYEVKEDGSERELGLPWGKELARELGVEGDFDRARQAVFAVFPQKTWLTQHYTDYTDWLRGIGVQVDDEQAADFR